MWDLPEPFTIELTVEDDDIDDYGHTNNAVYLKWLDRVAWAHADAVGTGPDVHQEMRRGMAMQRTELQYIAPAFGGDRLLIGDWIVFSSGRVRAQRRFKIVRPADGATLLRALGMYVCIDLDSGKPARMPTSYRERYVVLPAVENALARETWPFSISPSPQPAAGERPRRT